MKIGLKYEVSASAAYGVGELYLVWISNEQDFVFYDNSLLALQVMYSLHNIRRSQYERAGSFKFSFRSKDLYFHYGLPPVWAL